MPVNAFNGTHNWGYDGVLWSAVHEQYGGPAAYQRFVDGCHAAGIGVIQDVVHNHLGPSGNYLPRVRALPQAGRQHVGRPGQPRRRGQPRGAPLHPRQRADVVRRHARRRAAARRRARAVRRVAGPPARGDGGRGGRPVGPPAPAADPDRRVRPQRPAPGDAARGRRLRPRRPVERRLPPRRARRADRRDRRLLRRLRAARRRSAKVLAQRASSTTAPSARSATASTACRSTSTGCPRGGSWWPARTTTRSATGPAATGSPRRSTTTSWRAPRC